MAERGDTAGALLERAEAEKMENAAAAFLDIGQHVVGPIQPGNGGEMVVATREAHASIPGVIDTIKEHPDMLAASASRVRMELTGNALTLAVDTTESIQPRNNLEKMLAHQSAALHRLAMLFANKSADIVERQGFLSQTQSVEACRLFNASTKAMATYQDAMLALDRIRRGGKQTVRVVHVHEQHVSVAPGAQAVVAGKVTGGRGARKRTGGVRKNGR